MLAQIMTPWTGTGAPPESGNDPFRPLLTDTYPVNMSDVTRQPTQNLPPSPNLYIVRVNADSTVLDQIAADVNFRILWRENNKSDPPDAAEFGQIRALLAQAGVSQEEINGVIGTAPSGRSRTEIADTLRDWFATRPKAA